jgi:hypothetical protein
VKIKGAGLIVMAVMRAIVNAVAAGALSSAEAKIREVLREIEGQAFELPALPPATPPYQPAALQNHRHRPASAAEHPGRAYARTRRVSLSTGSIRYAKMRFGSIRIIGGALW